MDVPIIDLDQIQEGTVPVSMLDDACCDVGFFVAVNHEVPGPVVAAAWDAAREFFDLPQDEKLALRSVDPEYPYGYSPMEEERLAGGAGDLNESFNLAPVARPELVGVGAYTQRERLWPARPPGFHQAWLAYYAAMEGLASRLMRAFASALGMSESFFDDKIDRHQSALRALNYPAQPKRPLPGQLRAGAHTDYGSLTILLPGEATGGLEVLAAGGRWVAVPHVPGGFVVNLGDLMAMWTNDRWRSTLHRVVNPTHDVAATERRQSLAFFHQPNWDATIECLPTCTDAQHPPQYPATQSGPWLRRRVAAAH